MRSFDNSRLPFDNAALDRGPERRFAALRREGLPMSHWPWIQRTFRFDFPVEKMPDLLERVRGTPARLEERVAGLPREVLTRVPRTGWSIHENIGHLTDLGYLPLRRIAQILAGESVLIAADMQNEKTNTARHNERPITELLADFRVERAGLATLFESLPESDWGRSALHPRIKQPMRIVDIAYFDAEHDDYHMAQIGRRIREFAGR